MLSITIRSESSYRILAGESRATIWQKTQLGLELNGELPRYGRILQKGVKPGYLFGWRSR